METKDLIKKVRKEYVFYQEAIKILEKKYKTNVAKSLLTRHTSNGNIEKIEPFNVPALYKKKDLLTIVNK